MSYKNYPNPKYLEACCASLMQEKLNKTYYRGGSMPPQSKIGNTEDTVELKCFMDAALLGLYHVVTLIKMMVKPHTWHTLSLTLVKFAVSHMVGSILMRLSAKMTASHLIAIYS